MQGPNSKRTYFHDETLSSATNRKMRDAINDGETEFNLYDKVFYGQMFSLMTEDEFAFVAQRIASYQPVTLREVNRRIEEFLAYQESGGEGYHGGHIAFIIDVSPIVTIFGKDKIKGRDHFARTVGSSAYHFFKACGSNRDWINHSRGFMIGKIVDPNFGIHSLSSSHLAWLTDKAAALSRVPEAMVERQCADRDFCELLLSNASPALLEGVL